MKLTAWKWTFNNLSRVIVGLGMLAIGMQTGSAGMPYRPVQEKPQIGAPTPLPRNPTPDLSPVLPPEVGQAESAESRILLPVMYLPSLSKAITFADMVRLPAGRFLMGCDSTSDECTSRQTPLHRVIVGEYEVDKYEVTNARYAECVTSGACSPPRSIASFTRPFYYGNPEFDLYPVVNVDWNQARAYCVWAGRRLPTEAEWEKAARGIGNTRTYPWGNQAPDCTLANLASASGLCVGDTTRVGFYPAGASPFGVMDMAGNVWEWVADWFSDTYYSSYTFKSWPENPLGPATGTERGIRGGAWDLDGRGVRVSRRQWGSPSGFDTSTGFRCARSITP